MLNVTYTTVRYRFLGSSHLDGSIVNVECAADIPEGALVALDATGKAVLAGASSVVVGVARHPRKAGTMLAIENDCIVENTGTSLALTPGAAVFAAASGAVAGSGTVRVGYALSANRIKISL